MSKLNLRVVLIALMAALTLSLTGCGDSAEAISEDMIAVLKDLNITLDGVKDEATAKAAKPRIESITARMEDIKKRRKEYGEPTAEEKRSLQETYEKEMTAITNKIEANGNRIDLDSKMSAVLEEPLLKLQKVMMEM